MKKVKYLKEFTQSLEKIKDEKLLALIAMRIHRMRKGNFGDTKSCGDGVSEIRIHYGSGYRLYFTIREQDIVILLCSGEKSEQQNKLKMAKQLAKEV